MSNEIFRAKIVLKLCNVFFASSSFDFYVHNQIHGSCEELDPDLIKDMHSWIEGLNCVFSSLSSRILD